MVTHLGIEKKNKIFTVYNPIDSIKGLNNGLIERPNDGLTSFLFVGRLTEQKDPTLLIRAVSRLKGDWKLHIVGEGHLKSKLEALVRSFHIEENVIFHGWKSDAWTFIQSLTPVSALILTSKNEGFPMVLLEAMSRGIYCVASNCETGPADIVNKNNGQLFEVGNVDELTHKLQYLIDSKGGNLPSQISIKNSIEKFSSDRYCERIIEALRRGKVRQDDKLQ